MRRTVLKQGQGRPTRVTRAPQADRSMSTPQLLDLHRELQVRIFKIRYVVFLKGSGLELPRAGKPLDSSEAPRDLQEI